MVKCIGEFSLLMKRLRDAWMDLLPMSATSEQVTSHERLVPFSDNLTTLMFTVASDLSEAQRERLTSSLSPQGVNVTAYTLEAVRIVFLELFCTPNGHGGSTNRTFIVDNFSEDEFGQWTTDEVIGEQGYVDDEGLCSWTLDNHEYAWQSRPCRSRKLKKQIWAKERAKVDQQETEECPLVKNKRTNQNCGETRIVLGGPKANEARKASRRVMKAFGKVVFALIHQTRVQAMIFYAHKGRGKDQKGKGKEGAHPQSGLSASDTPSDEGHGRSWVSDDWYSSFSDDSSSSSCRGTTAWYDSRHTAWMASL